MNVAVLFGVERNCLAKHGKRRHDEGPREDHSLVTHKIPPIPPGAAGSPEYSSAEDGDQVSWACAAKRPSRTVTGVVIVSSETSVITQKRPHIIT